MSQTAVLPDYARGQHLRFGDPRPVRSERPRGPALLLAAACAALTPPAAGLMAGLPPDSPAARVDRAGERSPFAGVGSLSVAREAGMGTFTATAVEPRHVVTAAHVVRGAEPSRITFNVHAGTAAEQRIPAAAAFVHPGYRGFSGELVHYYDVAVVRLAAPLPEATPVYPLHRLPLPPGTVLILAGYGASGHGDTGVTVRPDPAVRRVGVNAANEFRPGPGGRLEIYLFDFDGPDLATNRMGGPTLGNHLETTVAGGDSGGPAFVRVGRRLRLAGVNTFQASAADTPPAPRFGSAGGGILISAHADWIESVIAASD